MKPFSKNEYSKLLLLALPAIIQDISLMLLNIVDTAMVGHLGAPAIASVAINVAPLWLINGIGTAVAIAGGSMISRSIGADEKENAGIMASLSILVIAILGISVSLLLVFLGKQLTLSMGASKDIVNSATWYVQIVGAAQMFQFLIMMINAIFRSIGDFKSPLYISLTMSVFNVIGDWILIFPKRSIYIGKIPLVLPGFHMEILGAAIATAGSVVIAFFLALLLLQRKKEIIAPGVRYLAKIQFLHLKKMISIALPSLAGRIVTAFGQMVFFRCIATMGTAVVAANSLAVNVEAISYTPVYGIASVAQTLTGISLGANEPFQARKTAKGAFLLGFAYMSFFGILFLLVPELFLRIFTKDINVIRAGIPFVRIMALMQPFLLLLLYLTEF